MVSHSREQTPSPSHGVGGRVCEAGVRKWVTMGVMRSVRFTSTGLHRRKPCRWLPKGKHEFLLLTGNFVFRVQVWSRRYLFLSHWTEARAGVVMSDVTKLLQRRPDMRKRQAASKMIDSNHLAAMESTLFHQHMALVEHCAVRKYDDGDPREPGWITVKTQGAAWVVQVKDPDGCCSFSAVGDTLDKALDTANLLLSCDEAPWEPDAFLAQAAARKKKK